MSLPMIPALALTAALMTAMTAAGPAAAQAAGKCEPATLSKTLHERMKQDGKSDAEIRDILGSSFKRKILAGRVADGSGCTAEQTDKALQTLEASVKQG